MRSQIGFRNSLGNVFVLRTLALVAISCLCVPGIFAQEEKPAGEQKKPASVFKELLTKANPKMVKVFGAGAGRVDGFATGIIVSDDGLILTAQGVFLDGSNVRVVTSDGVSHPASIVQKNRVSRLATLRIDRGTPDYFELSDKPVGKQGDFVIALTNAFKVADREEPLSASAGIISLRSSIEARYNPRDIAYAGDLVLIDAITSNPGAAGGAVIDLQGNLVGMVGKIINSTDTNTRLNYAVPSHTLKKFVEGKLVEEAQKLAIQPNAKADLGIALFKLGGRNDPAYVDRVRRGSPAREVGLKPDDLIVSLGEKKTATVKDYDEALKSLRPGEETIIIVLRGKSVYRIPITPIEVKKK